MTMYVVEKGSQDNGQEVPPPACEFYAAPAGNAQRCTRKVLWIADTGSGNHLSSPSQIDSGTMGLMKACSGGLDVWPPRTARCLQRESLMCISQSSGPMPGYLS